MNKTELVDITVATQAELLKQDTKKLWKPCLKRFLTLAKEKKFG